MVDVVSKHKRSEMMAGIQGKNTKPEMVIRKKLHSLGYRYRLHYKKLPGNPDMVFPKYMAAVFINGCFWHKHICHLFKWPSTRATFWKNKIEDNRKRDQRNKRELLKAGWRVLVVWECSLKGKKKLPIEKIISHITTWLHSQKRSIDISGKLQKI